MLRQALDAAATQDASGDALEDIDSPEIVPLIQNLSQEPSYASIRSAHTDDESDLRSSDDEEDWQDDDNSEVEPTPSVWFKTLENVRSCFRLVLNVDNLWDSPSQHHTPEISRRNHYIVFFWFFILASSYAMERSTFKLLVDRSGPFRLFAVEMVTCAHALMIAIGMIISAFIRKDFKLRALGIPVVDVGCKYIAKGSKLPCLTPEV